MSENTKSSNLYFPEFGGSTGGWLEAAETEEKYVMTWNNEVGVFFTNLREMQSLVTQYTRR
jgi:hypothetical protein